MAANNTTAATHPLKLTSPNKPNHFPPPHANPSPSSSSHTTVTLSPPDRSSNYIIHPRPEEEIVCPNKKCGVVTQYQFILNGSHCIRCCGTVEDWGAPKGLGLVPETELRRREKRKGRKGCLWCFL